ncbi:MAG: YraN family protein [Zoogloeaceae bacterium]|nr:YraN family protein [Zoogloeaceae bacterium]
MIPVKPKDTTDGARAEALAASFLQRHGLRVIEHNFRVRGGEIDLICRDGNSLVFVEVRLRTHREFGGASASISPAKRRRLILAARHYLVRQPDAICRFDCVLMDGLTEANIEWLRNAFSADDM